MESEVQAAAEPEVKVFTPEEDHAYAVACAKKQRGLSDEAAKELVEGLPADVRAKVVKAGRAGNVAEVRDLLGC